MKQQTQDRWIKKYNDQSDSTISNNLVLAKQYNTKYYRGVCKKHGNCIFYTKDNSCPLCSSEARRIRNETNRVFNRSRELINEIRVRARNTGLVCNITTDEFRLLYDSATICPVFRTPLELNVGTHGPNSASVDRFDSTKGYTMDNINIISNRANKIKNDGTYLEHIQIAIWMARTLGLSDVQIIQQMQQLLNEVKL